MAVMQTPQKVIIVPKQESIYQTPAEADAACKPPIRSRLLEFGPQFLYITISNPAIGSLFADIPVLLPFPCRGFQLASVKTPQNSVFFHLNPLGKIYPGSSVVIDGTENWIPMTAFPVASGAPYFWSTIKLRESVKQFYLDMGKENGSQNTITILCTVDPDSVQIRGGPWT